jgi:adenylate cyclase
MEFALALQRTVEEFNSEHSTMLQIQTGINTGPIVAGVIGFKKIQFDIWGDSVNVASRMKSYGLPGKIQVSAATYKLVNHLYIFESREPIVIKGKGEMQLYLYKETIPVKQQ